MSFPDFFDAAPRLLVRDPLADFLGAAKGGLIEYRYADAVKLAGHSCPTVAGTYALTRRALIVLYGTAVPERGGVAVSLREAPADGVAGVVAQVVTLLTGAAAEGGFKGLGGRFERRALLEFGADLPLDMRFRRRDTGAAVDARAQLKRVAMDPDTLPLMQLCLAGRADVQQRQRFGELWQARVRAILLDHADDAAVFVIDPVF